VKEQIIHEVGEVLEIDGKKVEITHVQGANFSYKPIKEIKVKVSKEKEK